MRAAFNLFCGCKLEKIKIEWHWKPQCSGRSLVVVGIACGNQKGLLKALSAFKPPNSLEYFGKQYKIYSSGFARRQILERSLYRQTSKTRRGSCSLLASQPTACARQYLFPVHLQIHIQHTYKWSLVNSPDSSGLFQPLNRRSPTAGSRSTLFALQQDDAFVWNARTSGTLTCCKF